MADPGKSFEVCVLIPCFNNLEGLKVALKNVEFQKSGLSILIVDDGSTLPIQLSDFESLEIPFEINILSLPKNGGITIALNKGLEWITTNLSVNYIARLDCSDVCAPSRFFEQVTFLNEHPEIGLVGSWCTFQKAGSDFSYNYITPVHHAAILKEMHFRNVFIHPTVMFRPAVLTRIGLYPENYPYVEDYAFFMIIAYHFQTAIIPRLLVTCEINPQGISIANRKKQIAGRRKVVSEFGKNPIYRNLGILRLKVLELVPYSLLLKFKQLKSNF